MSRVTRPQMAEVKSKFCQTRLRDLCTRSKSRAKYAGRVFRRVRVKLARRSAGPQAILSSLPLCWWLPPRWLKIWDPAGVRWQPPAHVHLQAR